MNRKHFLQRSMAAITLGSLPAMLPLTSFSASPVPGPLHNSQAAPSAFPLPVPGNGWPGYKTNGICTTCGTQFPPGSPLPELCPICSDDRQYVPESGQGWTSFETLQNTHSVLIKKISDRLYTLTVSPSFAIGQRAFLVLSDQGNILWDCIPLIDEAAAAFIRSKGGLKAIAFSHPHYYSTMQEWARLFDCPIYIHEADREWIRYNSNAVRLWEGSVHPLWDDIRIVNIGGHFPGSSLLQVPFLSGKGALLCGDSLYIARSLHHIAVMHSYPNQILLPKKEMINVQEKMKAVSFDTLYGAFEWQSLDGKAQEIYSRSMQRYRADYEI